MAARALAEMKSMLVATLSMLNVVIDLLQS